MSGGNALVFVLSKTKTPLMPCSPARARLLLKKGRAVVLRRFPFAIRLKDRSGGVVQPLSLKLDPGSKVTGIALVREAGGVSYPLFFAELSHRSASIHHALRQRSNYRRRRRSANLRYRQPLFLNRTRKEGWLAPSLKHRVLSTMSWVERFGQLAPVALLACELARFDIQAMENPEISGLEYQQGTLLGYEVREYLLEKWGRTCAYCGKKDVPLQVEHIHPKAKGGTRRISNLTLACGPCNQRKCTQPVEIFLKKKPEALAKILAQAKRPLRDAAALNTTRSALVRVLKGTGLPLRTGSGGRTKYNRSRLGIPKTHALDALCVGEVGEVGCWRLPTLEIASKGRGAYQRTRVDKYGFPRGYLIRQKRMYGFQTGDIVRALVPGGKKRGEYLGRVALRASGYFNILGNNTLVQGICWKYCQRLARGDGYHYQLRSGARHERTRPEGQGFRAGEP